MGPQVIPSRAGVFIGVAFTGTSRVRDVIRRRSGLPCLKHRGGPAEVHPAGQSAERLLAAPAGGIGQPWPGSHTARPVITGESGGARQYFL
jgi:hypothetical protein